MDTLGRMENPSADRQDKVQQLTQLLCGVFVVSSCAQYAAHSSRLWNIGCGITRCWESIQLITLRGFRETHLVMFYFFKWKSSSQ